MWEKDININEVKEIRTRTTVYFGVGAIKKIDDIAKVLKGKGIDKVIVMSGYRCLGLCRKSIKRQRNRICKLCRSYSKSKHSSCK